MPDDDLPFDPTLNPQLPVGLWLVLGFGLKHLVCLHLLMQRALGEAAQLLGDWRGAAGDVLVAMVALAALFRTPGAPRLVGTVWRAAKPLLVCAYLYSLGYLLAVHGRVLTDELYPGHALVAALVGADLVAIGYLLAAKRLPALFASFPELPATQAPAARPARAAALRMGVGYQLLDLHAGGGTQAERTLRQQLSVRGDDAEAFHGLGVLAFQAGRLREAVDFVRHATAIDGANPLYLRNLAELCRRAGLLPEALRVAEAAVRLGPSDHEAHFNLGLVLAALGLWEESAHAYRRSLGLDPASAKAWNNLGDVLRRLGKENEAVDAFHKALESNPRLEEAQINLGASRSQAPPRGHSRGE